MVMAIGGNYWLHRQSDPLNPKDEPKSNRKWGPIRTTETIPVGEVVNGIRELNRLVVFQAYVTSITTTHEIGWITQTDQTMITPAFVNYYIDMDTIRPNSIVVKGNDVSLPRAAIMIERPNVDLNNIQTYSAGIWSNLAGVNDRLRVRNSQMALQQLVARARMPFLADAARKAALTSEEVNIRHVLAARGYKDITVHIRN